MGNDRCTMRVHISLILQGFKILLLNKLMCVTARMRKIKTNRSVNESIDRSVYWSVDRSVNRSVYKSVYWAVNQSVNETVYWSVNDVVSGSVNQSVDGLTR